MRRKEKMVVEKEKKAPEAPNVSMDINFSRLTDRIKIPKFRWSGKKKILLLFLLLLLPHLRLIKF